MLPISPLLYTVHDFLVQSSSGMDSVRMYVKDFRVMGFLDECHAPMESLLGSFVTLWNSAT
jgi:hypothetical protein